MSAPDGGPAFPIMLNHIDTPGSSEIAIEHEGMSLRDYLAAAPMSDAELETLREAFSKEYPNEPLSIARLRYFRADTMLKTRQRWYDENQTPAPLRAPVVIPPQRGEE